MNKICNVCNGSKKILRLGGMQAECSQCNAKGYIMNNADDSLLCVNKVPNSCLSSAPTKKRGRPSKKES